MKNALAIWIWSCAYLNCAGWFLSAIHQLNAAGYAVALAAWGATLFIGKHFFSDTTPSRLPNPWLRKFSRRFKKPFPFAFLILAAMAFLGGAIHAPNNYDGLAYRIPRVLHWLAAGQWHWIHTIFPRVNASSCGIEWLSAPLIAFSGSDRLLFLINIISFLFLPGLVFSVFTRLGVRSRAAWHWMWIAPTGYCFLLQAGSIGNDMFAAPFALAAVDFALRSAISKSLRDLSCCFLAAALMTGNKFSNLPLLLSCLIALLPALKIFLRRPVAMAAICLIAAFASFVPKAIINLHFCHDWSGVSMEHDQARGHPAVCAGGNIALLTVLNLAPPVFPQANQWNHFVQETLPQGVKSLLQEALIEPGAQQLEAPEMQMDENAGLGFGVTVLLLVSVVFAVVRSGKSFFPFGFHSRDALWRMALVLAPWISPFALLSQSGVYPIGRIMAPFYLLLLPLLLLSPVQEQLVKKIWWRAAAFLVFAMAAGLLIISPARPLFPVNALLAKLQSSNSNSKLSQRIQAVYSVYRDRNNVFAPILSSLPPGVKTLGFISYDDPETALWLPFGSRRVIHVCPSDPPADLKAEGIEYIVAKDDIFGKQFPPLGNWLKTVNAQVVQKIHLDLRADGTGADWMILKLN
jgi:hypothetical protein